MFRDVISSTDGNDNDNYQIYLQSGIKRGFSTLISILALSQKLSKLCQYHSFGQYQ